MTKSKIEIIDINPKIKKEDAKHFMMIYFDVQVDKDVTKIESNTGHTYFELRDGSRDKSDFYGKNPAGRAPIHRGKILDDQEKDRKKWAEQYTEKSGETVLVAKSLPLTKEQYDKAFEIAEAEKADPTIYSLVGSNCANFVQDIYSKVGLEGYFTENFTKEELTKISSWLSFHIKHSYPSANTHWYDVGFSRQEVAKKHKISLDRVEEVGGYGHSAVHEIHYFVIKPMEEILASKARDTAGLAQAAKTLEIMISPWAKFIQQGEKLSQEELQTSVVMSMNYFEHIKMQELAGGAYGHGFVSASGGIGALSNNVLYANAALCHGTQEGFARACSAKVMLAAKDAEARAAKVNISEAEIRSIYQEAFKAAALSRSADLLALTKSISGSDKIYTLVPEVIDMLKSQKQAAMVSRCD